MKTTTHCPRIRAIRYKWVAALDIMQVMGHPEDECNYLIDPSMLALSYWQGATCAASNGSNGTASSGVVSPSSDFHLEINGIEITMDGESVAIPADDIMGELRDCSLRPDIVVVYVDTSTHQLTARSCSN